jgi:hypothetical protein
MFRAAMPETTVDKYGDSRSSEDYVCSTAAGRCEGIVLAEPEPATL